MTPQRVPSQPPAIPGHSVGRLLGMGGFADVFLYTQQLPHREVAVKVLLAEALDAELLTRFGTEADLMAQLSHHPSIVTIHQAAVAADGRPYLVMEYCSRPGLGARYRSERISVAEALRIGIRLASAVETAHRAGILHRDIKPANVLTTDFGWPALTDFGIAATTGWSSGAAVGMSIPWSPPEMLAADPSGDVRADVYSLAATVYSLLAGRSPFEQVGGRNGAADLITRIERAPLPGTGRTDVPPSLHAALARAMEKNPVHRFHSALALARALQQVERELMLPGTPVELADEGADAAHHPVGAAVTEQRDAATRLRPVTSIDPDGDRGGDRDGDRDAGPDATPPLAGAGPDPARSFAEEAAASTRLRPVASIPPEGAARSAGVPTFVTAARPTGGPGDAHGTAAHPAAVAVEPRTARRTGHRALTALAGLLVVGAVAGSGAVALGGPQAPAAETSSVLPRWTGPAAVVTAVPSPADVRAVVGPDGTAVFTWTNPQPQDGDRYLWGLVPAGAQPGVPGAAVSRRQIADDTTVSVPTVDGERVCLEVSVVRADRRASTRPAVGCTP